MAKRLLAIVGPTATGKTEVGILLAEMVGGEVVSADSIQVYRGMDIGSAKPRPEERARVPHHLIDILEPDEPFSVADYQARAEAALTDIWERGRQPILVGGSGLYVRAALYELDFPLAPPLPKLRERLRQEAKAKGSETLHARLREVDPEAAARIHPNDEKRIVRALEVYEQTGRPISSLQALDRPMKPRYNTRQFGLTLPRQEMYRRIEARVDRMMAEGLPEEVERLLAEGCGEDLVSMRGLGYAQLVPYLRGGMGREEAARRLKRDTRRYATRQLPWFRADPGVEWVDVEEVGGPERAAHLIRNRWQRQCSGQV